MSRHANRPGSRSVVRRRALALATVLVLACGATGCGSPEDRYCDAVTADRAKLAAMVNSSTLDSLITDLPLLQSLAAKAPGDLTDEWQTFVNAIEGLRDALTAAGLQASDFVGGRVPARVQGDPRRSVIAAADTLSSPDVVAAAKGIETQASDVCKVNLGL